MQKWRNLQSSKDFATTTKGGYAMQEASKTSDPVLAFRRDLNPLLRSRIREAI